LAALEKHDADFMFRSKRLPPENAESAQFMGASITARLAEAPRATLSWQGAYGPLFN
jgi:hypothetical protein